MSLKEGYKKESKVVFKPPIRAKKSIVVNGIDLLENVPPRTENEVRNSPSALSDPDSPSVNLGKSTGPCLDCRRLAGWSPAVPFLSMQSEISQVLWEQVIQGYRGGRLGSCGTSAAIVPTYSVSHSILFCFLSYMKLLRMFFRQQDEIRRLKVELSQKDIKIRQLQLELKNLRNSPQNNGL